MDDSSPPAAPPPTPPAHTASDPLDASKVASALGSKDGGEDSAPPGPNEAPKRRKVQWVGLSAPHRDEDSQMVDSPRPDNNAEDSPSNSVSHGTGRGGVPHLSIAMPQAAFPLEAAEYSAEGLRINRIHHDDDIPTRPGYELDSGNVTPASGGITPDSSRPASPSSDIDIMPGERDGLPTDPNRRPRTFAKEAAALVSLHKWKMKAQEGTAHRNHGHGHEHGHHDHHHAHAAEPKREQGDRPHRKLTPAASHNAAARIAKEHGAGHIGGSGRAGPSGGVLSNLLRLYDQQQRQGSSSTLVDQWSDDESVSGTASPAAGRSGYRQPNPSSSSLFPSRPRFNRGTSDDSVQQPPRRSETGQSRGRGQKTPPLEFLAKGATDVGRGMVQGTAGAGKMAFKGVQAVTSQVGERLDAGDRPAAARSGAGVFGALQASAMGLTGVAAPAAARIAPNPEQPGYRIARYSVPALPVYRSEGATGPRASTPSLLDAPLSTTSRPPLPTHPTRASADDVLKLAEQHSSDSTAVSHADRPHARPASIAGDALESPPEHRYPQGFDDAPSGAMTPRGTHRNGPLNLKALHDRFDPRRFHDGKGRRSGLSTPITPGTPGDEKSMFEKPVSNKHGGMRKRKDKRRQEEIFITMHIAAVLQRQQFIMQLTRSLMMFGGPAHRLESQIQSTAKVLDIDVQIVLIYSICLFSFQDEATHTSETKFIKQGASVDLGKLLSLSTLHYEVMHDKIGVQEASQEISRLMLAKPCYSNWQIVLIGALCSICIGVPSFKASFIDLLVAAPLGALVVMSQLFIASKSDVLSQIFEVVMAAICSFVAAAVAYTGYFCYSAVISSSIVLLLPGWLVCCAALELQSRSVVSGSIRLVYSLIYSLFLGLGISIGAQVWTLISGHDVDVATNGSCNIAGRPENPPWWDSIISLWWAFLLVPGYSFCLAMRQMTPIKSKEMVVTVLLACAGWTANHFASIGFPNRSDISSACGSFVVGLFSNLYNKMYSGTAFIVALVPILFQLPSGLANGGLLNFSVTDNNTNAFQSGLGVAEQLIQVSLGLVIGLFVATVIVYPFGKKRGGLMSF